MGAPNPRSGSNLAMAPGMRPGAWWRHVRLSIFYLSCHAAGEAYPLVLLTQLFEVLVTRRRNKVLNVNQHRDEAGGYNTALCLDNFGAMKPDGCHPQRVISCLRFAVSAAFSTYG